MLLDSIHTTNFFAAVLVQIGASGNTDALSHSGACDSRNRKSTLWSDGKSESLATEHRHLLQCSFRFIANIGENEWSTRHWCY